MVGQGGSRGVNGGQESHLSQGESREVKGSQGESRGAKGI